MGLSKFISDIATDFDSILNETKEEKEVRKANKKAAKEEWKEAATAMIEARGRPLGTVLIDYIGGYGPEYIKTHKNGMLMCYENEVFFRKWQDIINIPANQIVSFEITGKEQTNSRLSVTRMVTLNVFSLAAPKRSTKKEASIYIGLKDGRQILFHTATLSETEVHEKLVNAISHYSSLQASQGSQQQTTPNQQPSTAEAIKQFADLREQGIITDEEFENMKKRLLDL